jgi:hypothetical protein
VTGEQPVTGSTEEWTCGKGLAANAALPAKLGALIGGMAELLENHTRALPSGDANAQLEREAYQRLIKDQRAIAASLQALAAAMESYRDLPMGGHDESVLADQRSRDVFALFIAAEEDVLALLHEQTREHRAMLATDAG